ncbi:LacI family DNA-binding transcriptional regulator [Nocardioides fonticola]|uniref:LacI family DNA-binding transcriptional regulator n=1 Tax=Nocardioides fonticola TaxID=450363 RepID=A0ABP7XLW8_9ACTN
MTKRPTLQDVADAVGLSPATVSYALRGQRGSAETRARVQAAAEALGYQVDPIARALANGRSGTLAVLCGSTRDTWHRALATDLVRALIARDRRALLTDADGDADRERALLDLLAEQRADGLLVAALDPFAPHWEEVARSTPLVAIGDRLAEAPSASAVVFDNAAGFALVVDHLAALGHRRLLVLLPERPSTPDRPAETSVREAARARGLTVELLRVPPAGADPDAPIERVAAALVRTGATAVFCLSDGYAFDVLRAARRSGLRVPDDLSVVGFEDVEEADLVGPGLTTVSWDHEQVVETAVTMLLDALDHHTGPSVAVIAPRLVVRGTTSRPPAAR